MTTFFDQGKPSRRNAVFAALQFAVGLVAGLGLVWAVLFLQSEPNYLFPVILVSLSLVLALLTSRRSPGIPFPSLMGVLMGVLTGVAALLVWVLITVPGD